MPLARFISTSTTNKHPERQHSCVKYYYSCRYIKAEIKNLQFVFHSYSTTVVLRLVYIASREEFTMYSFIIIEYKEMFSFVQSKPKGRKHYYSFPLLSYDKFSNLSLGHNSSTSNFATATVAYSSCTFAGML